MSREELNTVLAAHYKAHRALEPQDVYKLIYQRVFGPEHLINNARTAKERLYLEVLHLPTTFAREALFAPLSPVLCRINLRPFVQDGGSIEVLWRLFRQTVREFQPGTLVDLERQWRRFLATPWAGYYAPEVLGQFWQRMATANFPPIHHSRTYAAANTPHYRVILRELAMDQLGFHG
jgi:hypothetical protein